MKTTKESSLDIVYGVHAVTESLEANTGNKLYIQDDLRGKNVDAIKALAAEKKVSISWTPKKTLSDMTGRSCASRFCSFVCQSSLILSSQLLWIRLNKRRIL